MRRVIENFKSFILTILIISSLVLTGSLWFDNYQGLSLLVSSFHNDVLDKFGTSIETLVTYDKVIFPYKATIINPDKNKWVFYGRDNMNENAWNLIKTRLETMPSETEIITGKVSEWDGLFTRKSIILEFSGSLENDILKLAISNLPKETLAFNDVEKIGITKSLGGNTIYILQNDNNKKALYKVLLKGEDNEIETFMQNCENLKTVSKYVELEKVGTTKFYNNKEVVATNNVLFPVANTKSHKKLMSSIKVEPYFKIEDEYSINRFIIEIFNNTDFAKFVTNDGSHIFINDDKSSIKFEKNGVVEYINNSKLEGEIASASKNFNVAMDFIKNMRVYENVSLLSAKEIEGLYKFTFSIPVNDSLLGLNTPLIGDDMHACIELHVKEESVRYFKGKLLKIENENKEAYVSNFTHNILDEVLVNVEGNTKINVSDIELMYIVDNPGTYYPNWVVKYGEKKSEIDKVELVYTVKK